MLQCLLCLLLLTTPVLYEGRYRPAETVPKEAAVNVIENYEALAGTVYLRAEGKALRYPTIGQLRAESLLYKVPYKWLLVGLYVFGAIFLFWKKRVGLCLLAGGFLVHTTVLALRCYILERPPVANMTETILYVPWMALITGFCFKRALFPAALGAACLLLFLPSKSSLENVQAVLDSNYWLIIHVMMVVGSYGIFCVASVLGHLFLIRPRLGLEKTLIQTLYVGTALLIGGTILGGVWAAESWGRFWDWDPKEAWAFISAGVYLIWIHAYRFKKIDARMLALGSVIGFMAITFTWYGVNYILGAGLHSYGFGHGGEKYYYLYLIAEIAFLMIFFRKNIYKKAED